MLLRLRAFRGRVRLIEHSAPPAFRCVARAAGNGSPAPCVPGMSGADLVDPNGELWYTRHQASLDPELVQRDARLRHAVSRDVAAACVDARQAKEWTVNSGRSISARRLGALSSPRNPPVPEWPELEPAEATAARLQSGAAEARRQERRQEREAAKREEVRRWREARDAERAARPVDGRSRQQRSPRAQRALQEAGRRGVAEFAERKIAAAEHQKELPRYGQWVVREKPKRREVRVADAGGGGGAGVAGRQTKLVLTAEEKLERQTKQIGKIVRDAVASNRSLGARLPLSTPLCLWIGISPLRSGWH